MASICLPALPPITAFEFPADELVLFESITGGQASVYRPLRRTPLDPCMLLQLRRATLVQNTGGNRMRRLGWALLALLSATPAIGQLTGGYTIDGNNASAQPTLVIAGGTSVSMTGDLKVAEFHFDAQGRLTKKELW